MNRVVVGDTVYHVINRANNRAQIFNTDKDYQHFESLLPQLDAFRTANWVRIQRELEQSGILGLFENKVLQNSVT